MSKKGGGSGKVSSSNGYMMTKPGNRPAPGSVQGGYTPTTGSNVPTSTPTTTTGGKK